MVKMPKNQALFVRFVQYDFRIWDCGELSDKSLCNFSQKELLIFTKRYVIFITEILRKTILYQMRCWIPKVRHLLFCYFSGKEMFRKDLIHKEMFKLRNIKKMISTPVERVLKTA